MWRQPGSGQEVARREAREVGLVLRTAPIPSCWGSLAQPMALEPGGEEEERKLHRARLLCLYRGPL